MAKIVDLQGFEIVHNCGKAIAVANGTLEPVPGKKGRRGRRVREVWTWLSPEEYEVHPDGTISVPEDTLKAKGLKR
jgi:hypothetical protein